MGEGKISVNIHKIYKPFHEIRQGIDGFKNLEVIDSYEFPYSFSDSECILTVQIKHTYFNVSEQQTVIVKGRTDFLITGVPRGFFEDRNSLSLLSLCSELVFGENCYLRGQMIALRGTTRIKGLVPVYASILDVRRKLALNLNVFPN